jgi:carboxylate-amine ligase
VSLKFGISAKFYKKAPGFFGETQGHIQYLETNIARWLGHKGALPLMIPSLSDKSSFSSADLDPFTYAKELDVLILQGGADIHPKFYGEEPDPSPYEYDEDRDLYELNLIEAFVKEGKPILGICRGFQLLNVYYKGTLYQDLEKNGIHGHLSIAENRKHQHLVTISTNGILSDFYKNIQSGPVISIHHQGIKKLGENLRLEAYSKSDNLIEAFSHEGDNYILGVQWHPEFHDIKNEIHLDANPLLESLYKAATNRRYYGKSKPEKKKKIKFGESAELSLGGEIELQIIDEKTFDLKPICSKILEEIKDHKGRIKSEIFQSMIEIESGVSSNAHEVEKDWTIELQRALVAAKKYGALLGGSGAHPFGLISDRILTPESRYQKLIERNQWIAKRIAIFGLHVHVGMPNREDAIKFYRFYMALSPLLLGLSVSSPFWEGESTGLASVRSTIFESISSGGHPPCLSSWQEFEGLFSKLVVSNSITSHKDLWWDLRPSIDYGTVELRICDVMPSIKENAAIIAFVHLLGISVNDNLHSSFKWPDLSEWSYRENKWRAARYGLDFKFILKESAETVPAKQYLSTILDLLESNADSLGYNEYMDILRNIINNGTSAKRQLEVFKKTEDLTMVVNSYINQLGVNLK